MKLNVRAFGLAACRAGSGTPNVLANDPNVSPGLAVVTTPGAVPDGVTAVVTGVVVGGRPGRMIT